MAGESLVQGGVCKAVANNLLEIPPPPCICISVQTALKTRYSVTQAKESGIRVTAGPVCAPGEERSWLWARVFTAPSCSSRRLLVLGLSHLLQSSLQLLAALITEVSFWDMSPPQKTTKKPGCLKVWLQQPLKWAANTGSSSLISLHAG